MVTSILNQLFPDRVVGKSCTPPKYTVVLLTPEMAKGLMEGHVNFRPLIRTHVDFLKQEILTGNWTLSGQDLLFDYNDTFFDGQHQCTACVETNISILIGIKWGLSPDAVDIVDTGRTRSAQDIVGNLGCKRNKVQIAAIAKILCFSKSGSLGSNWNNRVSNKDIGKVVVQYTPDILQESVAIGKTVYEKVDRSIMHSVASACFCILSKIDYETALEFMQLIPNTLHKKGWWNSYLELCQGKRSPYYKKLQTACLFLIWNDWIGKGSKEERESWLINFPLPKII